MVNRKLPTIFICVIFSFLFYSFAAAVTTLYSSGDSYITGDSHNNENNGSSPNLRLKHPPGFSHILVRFSQSGISSAVGSGTLVSAKLRMYIETNFNNWGSGTNVDVHRITQDWTELGVTWNCPIDTDLGNTNPNCSTQWAGGTYVTPQTNTVFQANTTGWAEWDVTADVQAFLSGTSNYGWLIRKRSSSASGSLDYTSREGNALYTPRLVVTVNNGPPIVTCTPTPGPNQAGWNNGNVTVTCSCTDPDGISFCTPSQQVISEGANQIITCQGTDSLGLSSTCSVTIKIDKTAPTLSITSPLNGAILNTCQPSVSGTTTDSLSGLQNVSCNGTDGTFSGGSFSCQPSLVSGPDTILVEATDVAGNTRSTSISVTNTTSSTPITVDSQSPVIAVVGDSDVVGISGSGFTDTMQLFLDGSQVPFEFINQNSILLSTNLSVQGVHSLEVKNPSSCPQSSSLLEPGLFSIEDGQILVYPDTVAPNGGESVSVYGNQGSLEAGATVYLANPNSSCASGRMQAQSIIFIDDKRLDVITPSSSLGSYDLFVDNPTQPDFCKAGSLTFATPPSAPAGYDARYSCCQSVPPPASLTVRQTVTVKLRVKNTGTTTWKPTDNVRLKSYNTYWGVSTVYLSQNVAPNQFYMFTFDITAPSNAGTYQFKWGMKKGTEWFGQTFPCTPQATCQSGDCSDAICTGVMSIQVTSASSCPAAEDSNCPDACPTDNIPDTDALQDCISNLGTVELVHASPGYIIDDGSGNTGENAALVIPANKTIKTVGDGGNCWTMSGNNPVIDYTNCALLKAAVPANNSSGHYLSRPMIKVTGGGVSIYRIIVDGEGATRRGLSQLNGFCSSNGRPGNIRFFSPDGSSWNVQKSVSMDAMCGTALRATGKNYLIDNNLLWDNGYSTASGSQPEPWADGITEVLCNGGTIKYNMIIDATDVGIAGGGTGADTNSCFIHHNIIRQNTKHAFAGIGIAIFSKGKGEWGPSTITSIWKNSVIGNNKMDFGIHMGKHAWIEQNTARGGFVGHTDATKGNSISGSSINLSVDGWLNGKVKNNQLSSPSNIPIDLSNYDCCGSVAYGKNFTIGDYANNGQSTLTNEQGTPNEELTTHVISVTNCSGGCGSNSNCCVCEVPPANNCACRNPNGTCASCVFPQSISIDEKEL